MKDKNILIFNVEEVTLLDVNQLIDLDYRFDLVPAETEGITDVKEYLNNGIINVHKCE